MPALTSIRPDSIRRSSATPSRPSETVYEAASQTYTQGTLLTVSSAGLANASIATGSNYVASGEVLLGFATSAATGTTNTVTQIDPIRPGDKFFFPVYHGTPASAVTAITDLDTAGYELRRDATYGLMVDLGNTGSPVCRITGIPTHVDGIANPIGESYGYVEVEFLAAELRFQ